MIRFWMWQPLPSTIPLDELLMLSCQRIQGYLHTNPTIRGEDRNLCEDVVDR